MDVRFERLIEPTAEIAESFNTWENDPRLIHLVRVNQDQESLDRRTKVTVKDLEERIARKQMYLIYVQDQLVGQMEFHIDPKLLYKKETGTAWIGIMIGEEAARGKGIGVLALQYLENEIKGLGLRRIELGVFEFNRNAIRLYQRLGYQEIGRIPDFTFWQGKLWADIRMEKYV